MATERPSYTDILGMRRNYVAKSCKLHFDAAPLKIVKASKQYMYDEFGIEYLDCISNVSHVGHCHPHVVGSGQEQMGKLTTSQGFLTDQLSLYAKKLTETLPERLCVCYFVNSGSEANDLALRLARTYTKSQDVVVFESAFHGSINSMAEISPIRFTENNIEKPDYVHIIPSPDTFRGKFRDEPNACELYVEECRKIVEKAVKDGRKIAAFVHEPLISQGGVIVPPPGYLKQVYKIIRNAGGLVLADEVAVGLGRTGDHYWSFQSHDAVPDIVTCGKPLGNGHPMAVVLTTKEIAESLNEFASGYGGNPVSCAIGLAVMDVIQNEKLLSSAKSVGRVLLEGFKNIMGRHPMMGDVRGQGLVVGVEIVTDKASRKPAKEACELLTYKMKQEKIIIANQGPDKNILTMCPPMCFTVENARRVISTVDRCLTEIESASCPEELERIIGSPVNVTPTQLELTVPLDVLTGDDDGDETGESGAKKARYEDLD